VILYDFHCEACDHAFESLVTRGSTEEPCPLCGVNASRVLSAAHVGLIGSDPLRRAEALQKRSHDHSVGEAKKNPERLARAYGAKPKSQARWNIRGAQKSSQ